MMYMSSGSCWALVASPAQPPSTPTPDAVLPLPVPAVVKLISPPMPDPIPAPDPPAPPLLPPVHWLLPAAEHAPPRPTPRRPTQIREATRDDKERPRLDIGIPPRRAERVG